MREEGREVTGVARTLGHTLELVQVVATVCSLTTRLTARYLTIALASFAIASVVTVSIGAVYKKHRLPFTGFRAVSQCVFGADSCLDSSALGPRFEQAEPVAYAEKVVRN